MTTQTQVDRATSPPTAGAASRPRPGDVALQWGTGAMAAVTAALVFLIAIFLAVYAFPAIRFNGLDFLTTLTWNMGNQYGGGPVARNGIAGMPGASFGVVVFLYGTLMSSFVAMLVATPVALLAAVAMVFRVPASLKTPVNTLVELMAGVPSVVFGLWGIVVLVPWIGNALGPWLSAHLGWVPFLGGSIGTGNGLLASGVVLAIMILPIMAATMRDVMSAVPSSIYEASIALGGTSWQAVTQAVLPAARAGIFGAAMLALGRALGETMAVLMVSGAAMNQLPQNIYQPINTMAAVIVSQLDSALTDSTLLAVRSLAEIALVLFAITLVVNVGARLILRLAGNLERSA